MEKMWTVLKIFRLHISEKTNSENTEEEQKNLRNCPHCTLESPKTWMYGEVGQ